VHAEIGTNPDKEQPLPVLGHAVPHRVEGGVAYTVPTISQVGRGFVGDVSPSDREHPWHVLHHNRERLPQVRRVKKTPVQLVTGIGRMPVFCEAIELRSPDSREALARWAANQNVRTAVPGEVLEIELILDIPFLT
jgi:hypothetical protein